MTVLMDLFGIAGALCIAGGIGWIYPPAGVIAGGILMLTGALLYARREAATAKPESK